MDENDSASAGLALVEAVEAEAAEAEARAEAARARARAARLRHELAASETDLAEAELSETGAGDAALPTGKERRARLRFRRPGWRTVAMSAAVALVAVLLTGNGFLAWRHHGADQERARAAQFAAVASQGVTDMTTLDFNKAAADVARVLENSTGEFHADFASRVDDFTAVVRDSKVVTSGTVNAAAVESMTRDSAVVLVAATSTVTNAAGGKEQPRKWRLSVTVSKDGDQLKMSKVEFVQ
jgi:Mce-associated membrane protein